VKNKYIYLNYVGLGEVIPIQDSNGPPDKFKKQLQIISIIAIIGLIIAGSALTIALLNMNDNSDDDSNDDQGTNQVADMDKDGIPDAQDIYDLGDAKLKISIDVFQGNYNDGGPGASIYPDPYFKISIDYNNDGVIDDSRISQTFSENRISIMTSPYFASFDIPDNSTGITIYIDVFDDNFEGAPWVYDITNSTSTTGVNQTITAPFGGSWQDGNMGSTGNGRVEYNVKITG
jgi:flagellar basal body-associated protein FliL